MFFITNIKISCFGHVHWTLKTAQNNINNDSFFPPISKFFFHIKMQTFPYLEMNTGPWQQYPSTWSIPHFTPEISPILLLFFIWHSHTFHIWKFTLDPETSAMKNEILNEMPTDEQWNNQQNSCHGEWNIEWNMYQWAMKSVLWRTKYWMKYLPMSNEIINKIAAVENEILNEICTSEQWNIQWSKCCGEQNIEWNTCQWAMK